MKSGMLSYRDISAFCLELSMLIEAGAQSGGAVALMADETADRRLKEKLLGAADKISAGTPLSEALDEMGILPGELISALKAGERTGRVTEALTSLSEYYGGRAGTLHRIRHAFFYPAVMLLVMISVIFLLLTKVLPIFGDVYASIGGQMGGIAGVLISLGEALDSALPFVFLVIFAAAVLLVAISSSERSLERAFGISGRAYAKGGMAVNFRRAGFAGALHMGIASGLSATEAVENASLLFDNIPDAKKMCSECLTMLEGGMTLGRALGESGLMPPAQARLITLGAESGKTESAVKEAAARLEERAAEALDRRISLIEPVIVIITTLAVGVILLSVMLPLTHIMSAI